MAMLVDLLIDSSTGVRNVPFMEDNKEEKENPFVGHDAFTANISYLL